MTKILGLLGMYFDAAVVEVKKNVLLFRFSHLPYCEKLVQKTKKQISPNPLPWHICKYVLMNLVSNTPCY